MQNVGGEDWVRLRRVAATACRTLRLLPGAEDVEQEALIAAWQHRDIRPDALLVTIVRRRTLDRLRKDNGRTFRRATIAAPFADDLLEAIAPLVDDHPNPVDGYGWTGAQLAVAEGLLAGDEKRVIAASLGVHPSRVSQILTRMRRDVEDAQGIYRNAPGVPLST